MAELNEDAIELELTTTEKASPLWKKIETHLVAKREQLRRKNDNEMTPEATARIRARISIIKDLLAAGESRD